jgi:hypothetical protein
MDHTGWFPECHRAVPRTRAGILPARVPGSWPERAKTQVPTPDGDGQNGWEGHRQTPRDAQWNTNLFHNAPEAVTPGVSNVGRTTNDVMGVEVAQSVRWSATAWAQRR